MSNPHNLVSVFLPTYNHEQYIGEAIESALDQDYGKIEIVIGDDCSQDATWTIVESYRDRYPAQIKAFRNPENLGITANCNEVLKRCTGEYIAFHAGDDVFMPAKLKSQKEVMGSHHDCILCYHDVEVFDAPTGRIVRHAYSGRRANRRPDKDSNAAARQLVAKTAGIMAQGVMIRRDAVPPWGYDSRVPNSSDQLMWIDICARTSGKILFLDKVLSRYRRHEGNITTRCRGDIEDQLVTLALVESRYPWLRSAAKQGRAHLYYSAGVVNIRDDRLREGRRDLGQSARQNFFSVKWAGWWLYSWFKQLCVSPK